MAAKPPPLVCVTWIDALTNHGWEDTASASADGSGAECVSVGFVIRRTDAEIILAQTLSGDQCNGRITIPMGWVKGKIVRLSK